MKEFLVQNYGLPEMQFTIDKSGLFTPSRLQKDGGWRGYYKGDVGDLMENDLVLDNLALTADYIPEDKRHKWVFSEGAVSRQLEEIIPIVHRKQKLRIPKFREFVRVFSGGDKRNDNLLVIDLDGNLRFVDPAESTRLSPIAFTLGFYRAGYTEYIGAGARDKKNEFDIHYVYMRSLRCWISHLKTQVPNISLSNEYFERQSEKELSKRIKTLTDLI